MKNAQLAFLATRLAPLASIAVLSAIASPAACAAEWPSHPIRIIVPSSAGGGTDLLARAIGQQLSMQFGVGVFVENRPGGDELIGADVVAHSKPDGYTILIAAANVAVNPVMRRTMPYAGNALKPTALLGTLPYVILTNPKLPAKTVAELVAYSKQKPGGLNNASGGTSNLLASESFRLATGADMKTIPYKGCAPSVMSVLAGQTDVTFCSAPAAARAVLAGTLNALAVTGDSRLEVLPDVPTTKELGDPKYRVDLVQWVGAFVPGATPIAVVKQLNTAINKALTLPSIKANMTQLGGVTAQLSVDEFGKFFNDELAISRHVVTQAKIPQEK